MASLMKRGETYYAAWRHDGRQRRKSLRTSNRKQARELLKHFEKELTRALLSPTPSELDCTPEALWRAYTPFQANKRPNTQSIENVHWKQFLVEMKPAKLGDVTREKVERLKLRWVKAGKAPKTINNFLTTMRMLYNFALGESRVGVTKPLYTGPNPFAKIARVKDTEVEERFLELDEIDNLLEEAAAAGRDLHLFVALGVYAGLRKNEIISAQWSWVSWQRKTLTVQAGDGFVPKSGKSRTVPMRDELIPILKAYREKSGYMIAPEKEPGQRYRYEPRKAYSNVTEAAGVPWCTAHILRHTFASQLAIANVSLYKLSSWMGHSHEGVTRIYAHLQAYDSDINAKPNTRS